MEYRSYDIGACDVAFVVFVDGMSDVATVVKPVGRLNAFSVIM